MGKMNWLSRLLGLGVLLCAAGTTCADNLYSSSWVGNSFGDGQHWVQNFINESVVDPQSGEIWTTSGWDEGGHFYGVYKDGQNIGNVDHHIDNKNVSIGGMKYSISGSNITRNGGIYIRELSGQPSALGHTLDKKLLVALKGGNSQVLVYDVSGTTPQVRERVGASGGIGSTFTIDYAVSPKYPAGTYAPGVYHPLKFWSLTGVGMDNRGKLCTTTSMNGTVVRCFTKSGDRWMLNWEAFGLLFVDSMDFMPGTDGTELCGARVLLKLDYSKGNGQEWSLKGITVDPAKDPNDVRIQVQNGYQAANCRVIKGHRYLMTRSMRGATTTIFKYEDEPSQITHIVGNAPINGVQVYWDSRGDLWDSDSRTITRRRFSGVDAKGNPSWGSPESFPVPNGMTSVSHLRYFPETDTMYVGGLDAEHPNLSNEPAWFFVRVVYRIDGFTSGRATLHPRYPIVFPYKNVDQPCNQNNFGSCVPARVYVADFAVTPHQLYAMFFVRGPVEEKMGGDLRGEVSVYNPNTLQQLTTILPGANVGGPHASGWMDMNNGGNAIERSNGETVFLEEEDFHARNLLYRSCLSRSCVSKMRK